MFDIDGFFNLLAASPVLQGNIWVTAVGHGVVDCSGHGTARDQADCVCLWFAPLSLPYAPVFQTPIQGKTCIPTPTHNHTNIHTL